MKIEFFASNKETLDYFDYPVSSKKTLPTWYKNMPRFVYNQKKAGLFRGSDSINPNTTVKACMPFRDALTSGYTWSLPVDLEIKIKDNNYLIQWNVVDKLIDEHSYAQFISMPTPSGSSINEVFKFNCGFSIRTPKGYSVLFTHPLNRHDLPFRTFSGVVDTDIFPLPVSFPFQLIAPLKEDDSLIIEKGTPIIQFIPIKRDKWVHKKTSDPTGEITKKNVLKLRSKIVNSYREQFWQKKSYE